MLVVGCIPNFSSERFVAVELLIPVLARFEFLARFCLLSRFSLLLSPMPFAYVSFPYTTTSIPP